MTSKPSRLIQKKSVLFVNKCCIDVILKAGSEIRTHVFRLEGEKFTTNLYPHTNTFYFNFIALAHTRVMYVCKNKSKMDYGSQSKLNKIPDTNTTQARDIGNNTFHPKRIS